MCFSGKKFFTYLLVFSSSSSSSTSSSDFSTEEPTEPSTDVLDFGYDLGEEDTYSIFSYSSFSSVSTASSSSSTSEWAPQIKKKLKRKRFSSSSVEEEESTVEYSNDAQNWDNLTVEQEKEVVEPPLLSLWLGSPISSPFRPSSPDYEEREYFPSTSPQYSKENQYRLVCHLIVHSDGEDEMLEVLEPVDD